MAPQANAHYAEIEVDGRLVFASTWEDRVRRYYDGRGNLLMATPLSAGDSVESVDRAVAVQLASNGRFE